MHGSRWKLKPVVRLAEDVNELKPYIRDSQEYLNGPSCVISGFCLKELEGTSLSIHRGEYPFVTSRDTTVAGCPRM